jgi:hypothetical protein
MYDWLDVCIQEFYGPYSLMGAELLYTAVILLVFSFYNLNLVIIFTMVFLGKVNSYLLLL